MSGAAMFASGGAPLLFSVFKASAWKQLNNTGKAQIIAKV